MADQRDLTLFAKSVPQQTVPIEPQEPVQNLINQLIKRNQSNAKAIANGEDEQGTTLKNRIAAQLLMNMLEGG